MKRIRMFLVLAAPLLASSAALTPPVQAAISCSQCLQLCLFQACGFTEPPACVSANESKCLTKCTAQGSC
jgi:hypothetical protein